jgi:hypothetical protein
MRSKLELGYGTMAILMLLWAQRLGIYVFGLELVPADVNIALGQSLGLHPIELVPKRIQNRLLGGEVGLGAGDKMPGLTSIYTCLSKENKNLKYFTIHYF